MKKIVCFVFSIIIYFFCVSSISFAATEIIEADGFYTIGDGPEENISIAKERARLEAMRNAIEKAGIYVESYSCTENNILTKNEINVIAGQILKINDCKIIPKVENNIITYNCHIKATIDTSSINLKQILDNKTLIKKNLDNEKIIHQLEQEIKEIKKEYNNTKNINERLKLQKQIYENENKLKLFLVQASDYNVYEFFELIKINNRAKNINFTFSNLIEVPLKNQTYIPYMISVNPNTNLPFCVVTLYTNRSGYVSKMTIDISSGDAKAKQIAYKVEYAILGALGLEDDRIRAFLSDILVMKTPFKIAIWNYKTNRNIVVQHGPSLTSNQLFEIRITAINDLVKNMEVLK